MKKILLLILLLSSYMFVSCDKKKDEANLENVISYVESLESYTYSSDMTIKRNSKEMNIALDVIYKKPYYNICFSSSKLDSQYIVKNSSGVYVLTPKVDKQFEFTSDWPLNSSHAYILEAILNDIKNDGSVSSEINEGMVKIKAKASSKTNPSVDCLEFCFDFTNKTPISTCFYNANNESIIDVKFKNFQANPTVSDNKFNVELIMNENQNETTNTEAPSAITISCGYTVSGVSLTSKQITDDYQILCYSGDVSYTIVGKPLSDVSFSGIYSFNDLEIYEDSLILYDETRAYMVSENIEISVYSSSLSKDELYQIISGIELA